jgi:hypothetical protein
VDKLGTAQPAPDDAPPGPVLDREDVVVAALVDERAAEDPVGGCAAGLQFADADLGLGTP